MHNNIATDDTLDNFFKAYQESNLQRRRSSATLIHALSGQDAHGTYIFFQPTGSSIQVPILEGHDVFVPLEPDFYGLPDYMNAIINPMKITDLEKNYLLHHWYQHKILARAEHEVNLTNLLHKITFETNRSITYDYDKTYQLYKKQDVDATELKALQKKDEHIGSYLGNCADAGTFIRSILYACQLPQTIHFQCVPVVRPAGNKHDTTLVLDTVTGNWTMLNSRTPRSDSTILSKEELFSMGKPFTR